MQEAAMEFEEDRFVTYRGEKPESVSVDLRNMRYDALPSCALQMVDFTQGDTDEDEHADAEDFFKYFRDPKET